MPDTSTAHSGTASILQWLAAYWWLVMVVGFWIVGWIGEVFDVGISAMRHRAKVRHKRRIELIREQARAAAVAAAAAHPEPSVTPLPGKCVHRRVKQVRDRDDELVGWLCVGCDTQLPADWAVAKEDLP